MASAADGLHIELAATHAGDWGWQIAVDVGESRAAMLMRNVIPESAAASRPSDRPAVAAGPYDVMVATWDVAIG